MNILWSARSSNAKTGDVPTAWIGASKEEARASCAGCPLLTGGCYAHTGTPAHAAASVRRSTADHSLTAALHGAVRAARMVRLSAIGDVGRCGKETADAIVAEVKAAGLAVVGYTHHWREATVAEAWRGRLMASCDTLADADRAIAEGWRAAVVLPDGTDGDTRTPAGALVKLCPAQASEGKVTCNTCRLCDGSRPGPNIGFRFHGNSRTRADRRRAMGAA